MWRKGVYHPVTAHGVKFVFLTGNVLLHDSMAQATLVQACQLCWYVCRPVYKHYIVCLHGMHITPFDPPPGGGLEQYRTDGCAWLCGVERDDHAAWEGHRSLTERGHQ